MNQRLLDISIWSKFITKCAYFIVINARESLPWKTLTQKFNQNTIELCHIRLHFNLIDCFSVSKRGPHFQMNCIWLSLSHSRKYQSKNKKKVVGYYWGSFKTTGTWATSLTKPTIAKIEFKKICCLYLLNLYIQFWKRDVVFNEKM